MLKKSVMTLLALVVLALSVVMTSAQDLPDLGGATITIAIENLYPPFNYIDEASGEAVGWDYDAIREICARLNCVPDFVETSWDGMINAVANGEFDMAADGITITVDRYEVVDFSIGYVQLAQRLMVRIGEDRFSTAAEFAANPALKIGVQSGTTNYLTAEALVGEDRLVVLSEFGAAVQALIAGEVDAVVIDDVAAVGYIGQNADKLTALSDALTSERLGFIYPKYSPLRQAVDMALKSMIADGTLQALNEKWLQPKLED
jgi:polar amino acid transport system substrate-binding protein